MKQRLSQKCALYPFFKRVGESIAVFYDYRLFDNGLERVAVPFLAREFEGVNARMAAHRAIMQEVEKRTGLGVISDSAAMGEVYRFESAVSFGL